MSKWLSCKTIFLSLVVILFLFVAAVGTYIFWWFNKYNFNIPNDSGYRKEALISDMRTITLNKDVAYYVKYNSGVYYLHKYDFRSGEDLDLGRLFEKGVAVGSESTYDNMYINVTEVNGSPLVQVNYKYWSGLVHEPSASYQEHTVSNAFAYKDKLLSVKTQVLPYNVENSKTAIENTLDSMYQQGDCRNIKFAYYGISDYGSNIYEAQGKFYFVEYNNGDFSIISKNACSNVPGNIPVLKKSTKFTDSEDTIMYHSLLDISTGEAITVDVKDIATTVEQNSFGVAFNKSKQQYGDTTYYVVNIGTGEENCSPGGFDFRCRGYKYLTDNVDSKKMSLNFAYSSIFINRDNMLFIQHANRDYFVYGSLYDLVKVTPE